MPSDRRHFTACREALKIVPISVLFNSRRCMADRHFWAGKPVPDDCDSVVHRTLKIELSVFIKAINPVK